MSAISDLNKRMGESTSKDGKIEDMALQLPPGLDTILEKLVAMMKMQGDKNEESIRLMEDRLAFAKEIYSKSRGSQVANAKADNTDGESS